MENLKHMKKCLTAAVEHQMSNLDCVDAKELGEAVDMIKDLEEAMYYCAMTKSLEQHPQQEMHYYTEPGQKSYSNGMLITPTMQNGRVHYNDEMRYYDSGRTNYRMEDSQREGRMRDYREGRSPMSRKMYMESKELHHDKMTQLKDLEKYMQELSSDITEMIEDASIEEKQLLQKKLNTLATKVING